MSNNPQGSKIVNSDYVYSLIEQIENTTSCAALELLLDTHFKFVTELITAKLEQQKEIVKKFFPLASAPGPNPFAIVSWIKKFISGTVMPQMEAYIKYAVQIIELSAALSQLSSALRIVPRRVEACITDAKTNFLVETLDILIGGYVEDLNTAIGEINSLQNILEDLLGEALVVRIDTSNLPAFTQDLAEKFNDIQQQVNTFIDTPIIEPVQPGAILQFATDGSVQWGFPDPGELI
jgi:hypothetical protein